MHIPMTKISHVFFPCAHTLFYSVLAPNHANLKLDSSITVYTSGRYYNIFHNNIYSTQILPVYIVSERM